MDELEAIASYAISKLDIPDELKPSLIHAIANTLYWERKLVITVIQSRLRKAKLELEDGLIPREVEPDYTVAADINRIHRKWRGPPNGEETEGNS